MEATACLQNSAYPTDLTLLNASRAKSEKLIDNLYDPVSHIIQKPRTYREEARNRFLIMS